MEWTAGRYWRLTVLRGLLNAGQGRGWLLDGFAANNSVAQLVALTKNRRKTVFRGQAEKKSILMNGLKRKTNGRVFEMMSSLAK